MFSFLNKISGSKKQQQQQQQQNKAAGAAKVVNSHENLTAAVPLKTPNFDTLQRIQPQNINNNGGILSGYFTTGRSFHHKKNRATSNLGENLAFLIYFFSEAHFK